MMSTAQIKKPDSKTLDQVREEQRQALINSFNWQTRQKGTCWKCEKDVSIAVNKCGADHHKPSFDITFRNGVAELITEGQGRISVAFLENRIYFKPDENGYKVSDSKNPDRKTSRLKLAEDHSDFIGSYDLQFDSYIKLYFVEKGVSPS